MDTGCLEPPRRLEAPSLKAVAVSGATPFLGYTVEPAGCSLTGPGALALLKIDRLGGSAATAARWEQLNQVVYIVSTPFGVFWP